MEEWIPVYATVIGPKLRRCGNILGCSDGEVLGILNFLWMWGRYNTEESGLILYADKTDIANCILMQNRGSMLDPNDVVDALIECGWIDEVGNELYIHDWDVWQSAWIKLKKTRERDAMRKRDARKREKENAARIQSEGEKKDAPVENPPDAPADSPPGEQLEMGQLPKLPEKAAEPKPPAYSEEFEKWWKAYPRRLDKGNVDNRNDYTRSTLKERIDKWVEALPRTSEEAAVILPFEVDLSCTDRSKSYGTITVKAAPLTLWQYGQFKELIPLNDDDWYWLVTPWTCRWLRSPRTTNYANSVWLVYSDGGYYYGNALYSSGIRPALLLNSDLLVSLDDEVEDDSCDECDTCTCGKTLDLSGVCTKDLISEIYRRLSTEEGEDDDA